MNSHIMQVQSLRPSLPVSGVARYNAEANERAELRNGLEPVDVENDPKAQTDPLQSKAGF